MAASKMMRFGNSQVQHIIRCHLLRPTAAAAAELINKSPVLPMQSGTSESETQFQLQSPFPRAFCVGESYRLFLEGTQMFAAPFPAGNVSRVETRGRPIKIDDENVAENDGDDDDDFDADEDFSDSYSDTSDSEDSDGDVRRKWE